MAAPNSVPVNARVTVAEGFHTYVGAVRYGAGQPMVLAADHAAALVKHGHAINPADAKASPSKAAPASPAAADGNPRR
jgi:hypothetical protein